jgi:hypothetical protein
MCLTIGGLIDEALSSELICFGVIGVIVFQGVETRVM